MPQKISWSSPLVYVPTLFAALILQWLGAWIYTGPLGVHAIAPYLYGGTKILMVSLPLLAIWLGYKAPTQWKWKEKNGWLVGIGLGCLLYVALAELTPVLRPIFDSPLDVPLTARFAAFGVTSYKRFVVFALIFSLLHSLFEEWYWRWFVFGSLRSIMPLWAATFVSAGAFGAHHFLVLSTVFSWSLWTWLFGSVVILAGVLWNMLLLWRKSIIPGWISHIFVDLAIFAAILLYVTD